MASHYSYHSNRTGSQLPPSELSKLSSAAATYDKLEKQIKAEQYVLLSEGGEPNRAICPKCQEEISVNSALSIFSDFSDKSNNESVHKHELKSRGLSRVLCSNCKKTLILYPGSQKFLRSEKSFLIDDQQLKNTFDISSQPVSSKFSTPPSSIGGIKQKNSLTPFEKPSRAGIGAIINSQELRQSSGPLYKPLSPVSHNPVPVFASNTSSQPPQIPEYKLSFVSTKSSPLQPQVPLSLPIEERTSIDRSKSPPFPNSENNRTSSRIYTSIPENRAPSILRTSSIPNRNTNYSSNNPIGNRVIEESNSPSKILSAHSNYESQLLDRIHSSSNMNNTQGRPRSSRANGRGNNISFEAPLGGFRKESQLVEKIESIGPESPITFRNALEENDHEPSFGMIGGQFNRSSMSGIGTNVDKRESNKIIETSAPPFNTPVPSHVGTNPRSSYVTAIKPIGMNEPVKYLAPKISVESTYVKREGPFTDVELIAATQPSFLQDQLLEIENILEIRYFTKTPLKNEITPPPWRRNKESNKGYPVKTHPDSIVRVSQGQQSYYSDSGIGQSSHYRLSEVRGSQRDRGPSVRESDHVSRIGSQRDRGPSVRESNHVSRIERDREVDHIPESTQYHEDSLPESSRNHSDREVHHSYVSNGVKYRIAVPKDDFEQIPHDFVNNRRPSSRSMDPTPEEVAERLDSLMENSLQPRKSAKVSIIDNNYDTEKIPIINSEYTYSKPQYSINGRLKRGGIDVFVTFNYQNQLSVVSGKKSQLTEVPFRAYGSLKPEPVQQVEEFDPIDQVQPFLQTIPPGQNDVFPSRVQSQQSQPGQMEVQQMEFIAPPEPQRIIRPPPVLSQQSQPQPTFHVQQVIPPSNGLGAPPRLN